MGVDFESCESTDYVPDMVPESEWRRGRGGRGGAGSAGGRQGPLDVQFLGLSGLFGGECKENLDRKRAHCYKFAGPPPDCDPRMQQRLAVERNWFNAQMALCAAPHKSDLLSGVGRSDETQTLKRRCRRFARRLLPESKRYIREAHPEPEGVVYCDPTRRKLMERSENLAACTHCPCATSACPCRSGDPRRAPEASVPSKPFWTSGKRQPLRRQGLVQQLEVAAKTLWLESRYQPPLPLCLVQCRCDGPPPLRDVCQDTCAAGPPVCCHQQSECHPEPPPLPACCKQNNQVYFGEAMSPCIHVCHHQRVFEAPPSLQKMLPSTEAPTPEETPPASRAPSLMKTPRSSRAATLQGKTPPSTRVPSLPGKTPPSTRAPSLMKTPSTRAPSTREPTTREPSVRAPSARAPSTREPSARAPSARAPSTRAPSTKAQSLKPPHESETRVQFATVETPPLLSGELLSIESTLTLFDHTLSIKLRPFGKIGCEGDCDEDQIEPQPTEGDEKCACTCTVLSDRSQPTTPPPTEMKPESPSSQPETVSSTAETASPPTPSESTTITKSVSASEDSPSATGTSVTATGESLSATATATGTATATTGPSMSAVDETANSASASVNSVTATVNSASAVYNSITASADSRQNIRRYSTSRLVKSILSSPFESVSSKNMYARIKRQVFTTSTSFDPQQGGVKGIEAPEPSPPEPCRALPEGVPQPQGAPGPLVELPPSTPSSSALPDGLERAAAGPHLVARRRYDSKCWSTSFVTLRHSEVTIGVSRNGKSCWPPSHTEGSLERTRSGTSLYTKCKLLDRVDTFEADRSQIYSNLCGDSFVIQIPNLPMNAMKSEFRRVIVEERVTFSRRAGDADSVPLRPGGGPGAGPLGPGAGMALGRSRPGQHELSAVVRQRRERRPAAL